MKTTKQARRDAKQLFRSCQANGLLDEQKAREAVRKVIEAKPRGYMAVLAHFQRLVKLDQDRRTARIESAAPLASDMQKALEANLTRLYGAGLNLSFAQNPSLIGGLRIKVGSDVYDGSVQARLAALQEGF
ncbi:MAG TPA: F0F1 ATP synthase subunit delta [Verrucomicrobiae bacterium]|nr:F0F1 ATP synthase subunit delta [Verrucomicrobiae bacterium]